ncbi:MAG TPA: hypothetical protein VG759_17995 [Candidatus Angelobacter sp.]|jgi:hypothetical protein|nr:hypothetical protein [Candidatus Angelobacter sp.]
MKINRWLFWSGLLVYAVAFALPAIFAPDSPALPGYRCAAFVTVMQPWSHENRALIHDAPLRYLPMAMTGWINPLFLVTTLLILLRKAARLVGVLRIIILLLIPFCWVVFHYETVRPREGHILWILGMLLVLFSVRLRQKEVVSRA